jgi:hypothetical protein
MTKQTSALRAPRSYALTRHWLITSLAAAALAACGGGGGGGNSTPTPQPITGTAAAGAPVVGTVTVKDSTGASKTSTIAADGSYSVNVAGMTGPFVFMADGTVGGRTIQMVSAATSADVNKTINITPFTDLIVANMAGEAASNYYASPTFSKLTAAELDAARQTLTTRLLPILNALGVAAGFDLLRSSFAADHSGFDQVMDVVRVSTDVATQTATITDLVNHTQIQDNLASKADATVIATPPLNSLTNTVESLKGIEDTLSKFSAVFATGLPASDNAVLRGLVSTDMLDWGAGADAFLSTAGVLNPRMVGVKQSGVSIVAVSDSGATLDVEFPSVHNTADYYGRTTNQWQHQFRRNAQGVWQYAGNRRWAYTEVTPINARFPQQNASWEYRPYVMSWIETRNPVAAYALLSGPGLANWAPPSLPGFSRPGLVLGRRGGTFQAYSINGVAESTWIPDCSTPYGQHPFEVTCIDLTKVSVGSVYSYTLLDANGVPMGTPETIALPSKPYSAAESAAGADAWFGRISATDPTSLAGLIDGKRISYTVVAPTYSTHSLWRASLGTPTAYLEAIVTGGTVDVGVWSGPTPTDAHPTLTVRDATGRRFSSNYDLR